MGLRVVMRWRRAQPAPGPVSEPALQVRTLDDAEVHQLALGVAIAAAYVPGPAAVAAAEEDIRSLLAGLNAADLVEICGDVAAFSVSAFRINGCDLPGIRSAFQELAYKQAAGGVI